MWSVTSMKKLKRFGFVRSAKTTFESLPQAHLNTNKYQKMKTKHRKAPRVSCKEKRAEVTLTDASAVVRSWVWLWNCTHGKVQTISGGEFDSADLCLLTLHICSIILHNLVLFFFTPYSSLILWSFISTKLHTNLFHLYFSQVTDCLWHTPCCHSTMSNDADLTNAL